MREQKLREIKREACNGTFLFFFRGYIGIVENEMETTIVYRD